MQFRHWTQDFRHQTFLCKKLALGVSFPISLMSDVYGLLSESQRILRRIPAYVKEAHLAHATFVTMVAAAPPRQWRAAAVATSRLGRGCAASTKRSTRRTPLITGASAVIRVRRASARHYHAIFYRGGVR